MKIDRIRGGMAATFLVLCLVLGGSSGWNSGVLANAFLQITATILILALLWTRPPSPYPQEAKLLTCIIGLYVIVVLLSLVPLPSGVWQSMPGREPIARGFQLMDMEGVSLPTSLAPQKTLASIWWLLPPLAMFLLTLRSSHEQRKKLPWVMLAMAVLSIALGAAQLLGGEGSRLRFYAVTNNNLPVGFFASANYLADFLLCSLPFAGYVAARSSGKRRQRGNERAGLILAVAVAIFIFVGIGAIGSFAGYGLSIPVAAASFLIYRRASAGKVNRSWSAALAGVFAVFLALAVSGPLDQSRLASNFGDRPESRKEMAINTAMAAGSFLPFGSGLGTFEDIYRTVSDPDRVTFTYVNHAHNDYLEFALELGLPGILMILAFLLWWGMAAVRAWRSDEEGSNLARAGSVVIAVVLFHSLVDFPIRSSAIAAVFAMACALMVRPWVWVKQSRVSQTGASGLRHLSVE